MKKTLYYLLTLTFLLTLISKNLTNKVNAQQCGGGTYDCTDTVCNDKCIGGIADGHSCSSDIDCPGGYDGGTCGVDCTHEVMFGDILCTSSNPPYCTTSCYSGLTPSKNDCGPVTYPPPVTQEICYSCSGSSCESSLVDINTCTTDCAACPPPSGTEPCSYCSGSTCSSYQANTGTCASDCSSCPPTSCTPSCLSPGDFNECGNIAATPLAPSNITINSVSSPGDDVDLTNSATLNISWQDNGTNDPYGVGASDYYRVYIWDKSANSNLPSTCDSSNKCIVYTTTTTTTSLTATADAVHDNDINVAVEAVNFSPCLTSTSAISTPVPFYLVADVTGNFYNDPDAITNGLNGCSGNTTGATFNTSSWDIDGSNASDFGTGLTYNLLNIPYAPSTGWTGSDFNIHLDLTNQVNSTENWTCICPTALDATSCEYADNTAGYIPGIGRSPDKHFYLASIDLSHDAWWQTSAGNIYGATSLSSEIPDTCEGDPVCSANLIQSNSSGDNNSAGVPITGASNIYAEGYYTDRTAQTKALETTHENMIKEDYTYFTREVDLSATDTISGSITLLPTGATPDLSDNTEIYYRNGNLSVDFTGTTQNITAIEKKIIFVNGDITFNANTGEDMLTVEEGGYIAFIASGDIIFDPNIGNAMAYGSAGSTTPNIAGVFIADGNIKLEGYSDVLLADRKFIGEGTFVGWSGFDLSRDYSNDTNPLDRALNNTNPTAIFNFRPDFNTNTPNIMTRPSIVWQEVN